MILEEVMSQTRMNTNIDTNELLREHNALILEHNELISEMADIFVTMLNEECIFMEGNFFSDMKVKKEDLADPNKVKAIIKQIDKDRIVPEKKDSLLNFLYGFLLSLVGAAPGIALLGIGGFLENPLLMFSGELIGMIGIVIAGLGFDRLDNYVSKTKKSIAKVEKKLKKEKDPKNIKAYKSQLNALQKNLKLFEDANYKAKKEIKDKTRYNY